jgi:hypothetical protein
LGKVPSTPEGQTEIHLRKRPPSLEGSKFTLGSNSLEQFFGTTFQYFRVFFSFDSDGRKGLNMLNRQLIVTVLLTAALAQVSI